MTVTSARRGLGRAVRSLAAATGITAGIAAGTAGIAACGSGSGTGGSSAGGTAGSPVAVGYEVPLTGTVAANGKQEQEGWNLALKQLGASVDGHPIVTYFEDTGVTPSVALSDAHFLVQQKHISIMEGPLLASQIAPVATYLGPLGIPLDNLAICSGSQLTEAAKYGNAMSSGWVCNTPDIVAADYLYSGLGYRHVTVVATDYAFGWLSAGGFIKRFTQLGGKIDKVIWPALTATDFSAYVSAIPRSTQAVFSEGLGAGAVDFTKAYAQYGLRGKIPLYGNTTLFDYSVLPSEASDVLGDIMIAQYCDGISSPANSSFTTAFAAAYGTRPGYYAEVGYVHAELLINALKKLGGTVTSQSALASAIRSTAIVAPRGPVALDPKTFGPVQNIYACKVTDVNGTTEAVPVKTWPAVKPWGTLSYSGWLQEFMTDSRGHPAA